MTSVSEENICVVLPAFNEEQVIGEVIEGIKKHGYRHIIVVDDASLDKTGETAALIAGVTVLTHKINRGKGAATKTGIEAAKLRSAAVIVTMDADGQHDPGDINRLVQPIRNGKCEVTLGTRLTNTAGMPARKILANQIGNLITWLLYGLWVTDSQSGMRAYSKKAAELIETKADRYEYESEVIREIKNKKLRFLEVPIRTIYTEYSMGKRQKQGLINGLRALYKMIWNMIS